MKDTELSKEVWAVKDKNGTAKISWSIFGRFPPYNPESKRCYLCLNEKVEIDMHKEKHLLNRRCELVSKCRHQTKYKLSNLTSFPVVVIRLHRKANIMLFKYLTIVCVIASMKL